MQVTRKALSWLMALAAVALVLSAARADDKPSIVRVSFPGVGVGNRPVVGGTAFNLLQLRGTLEDEFKADGVPVKWTFLRGAGPAVNELFANNLDDVSLLGDLPSIVGRAGGLKTRILASAGKVNLYVVVPTDSPVKTLKDLRGKRFGVFKGTCLQLSANRIFEANGFSEKDVRSVNMDTATLKAALITKDIDGGIGTSDIIALRDQGAVRIIYQTKGDPRFTCNSTVIASDDFVRRYPSYTKRIVRQYVLAAKWITDHEHDLGDAYRLWAKSGTPFSNFKEDWSGESVRDKSSPLVDPYLIARYRKNIADAKRFGLIHNTFELEPWLDTSFLEQVLKEEKLESEWRAQPAVD